MIMKWEYDFEGTWTTIPRVRDATAQGVAGHCADEDKEDEKQLAVQGQHMVQDVCRQQWKLCVSDSGESSWNMCATPPGSMVIVRVQGVAVIVDCNEESELVCVQGGDRLRRATSCKLRHWILSRCLFL